ncbi:NYN domain-containing protein [Desulfofundulus sp.]|uniref:NYN domain-containing protein n=1 Tax=Desulfofundulus sp. TaxID=2282750 RepID=UPI003C7816BB
MKGVDIKLAVDMLSKAIKNHYDVAILVSGDADFVEVVQEVKDLGKHVELAAFPQQPCYHLKKYADRFILLDEQFMENCWK